MNNNSELVVGIILDKRGDPPYVSVNKLWNETVDILHEYYRVEVYVVDTYFVDNNEAYREFVNKIDILMLLSPYYTIDRAGKDFPVVFYGLGSMQKGGHWIADNTASFRSYDNVILNCLSCIDIFSSVVKNNSIGYSYIPFGVDTSVFYPQCKKKELRHKYGISEDSFIMTYCGRLNAQKNVTLLLSILYELKDVYSNLKLMFIGSFDDFYIPEFCSGTKEKISSYINNLIDEYGLSDRVIFFETAVDEHDYAEKINIADIGINLTTLISENFGYTPVEMQSCGLPVIGTEWGGLKDTIIDGVSGYLIDTVHSKFGARINVDMVKERIGSLIENRDNVIRMGRNARKNVEDNFSKAVFSKRIYSIINKTYNEFKNRKNKMIAIEYDSIMDKMCDMIKSVYGTDRHTSWEYLHPELNRSHYDMIASKCASRNYKNIVWDDSSYISKGFDWHISNGKLVSCDPRWNNSAELPENLLDSSDASFLKNIKEKCTIASLIKETDESSETIYKKIRKLTDLGYIIPWKPRKYADSNTAAFIIPFYSSGNEMDYVWLNETLSSVADQSDDNWVAFIIDDASSDVNVPYRLHKFKEKYGERLQLVFLTENKGPGSARNAGIKKAYEMGCPFVMYLDSDDLAHKDRLSVTRKIFENNSETGVVYSSFDVIDEYGNITDEDEILPSILEIIRQHKSDPPQGKGVWLKIATETGYINLTSATSVRTEIAYNYPFPEVRVSEDYYTWLVYSASGCEFTYSSLIPARYRISKNGDSRSREAVGSTHMFNKIKSKIDLQGFETALDLVIKNGEINHEMKNELMIKFCLRKAESMKLDDENEIAIGLLKMAYAINPELTNLLMNIA